ncbi:bifunctional diaminohydroxyphosphoribosylaminopyrimidine deaminase/5-amino-6-(5-phosphoribosylamino)uracil reductase RibD [bacterium]
MDHKKYIKRALELAKRGIGNVSPNPRVGALIVKNNRILSEGYHAGFGEAHAEIDAINKLSKNDVKNAQLYINLEPCSHHGKTPPCTKSIIESGISTVIFGMKDPNPRVAGKGLRELKQAGIQIIGPVLEEECLAMNVGFVKTILKSIPWITVKIAQTLDSKIALENGHSKWITCETSRRLVHQWRSEHDAVLVGVQTVMQDNPLLNVRMIDGPSPKRIVLDTNLRIPYDANIIQNNPEKTIVITSKTADDGKKHYLADMGVYIFEAEAIQGKIVMNSIWKKLIDHGICSVFVEGGQKVFSNFLELNMVDLLYIFTAPKFFGHGINAIHNVNKINLEQGIPFTSFNWKSTGDDMLFEGRITCLQDWLKNSASLSV